MLDVLKAANQPLSPQEVAAKTWTGEGAVPERHVNIITQLLRRLHDQQLVACPRYGHYVLAGPTTPGSHS